MAIPSQSQPSQTSTNTNDASSLPPLTQPSWRSSDYVSCLAQIEQLQRQLHQIRLAPREVAYCLAKPKESPEATMESYREVSERAGKRIEEFKEAWMKEETARMFGRCREIEQKLRSQSGSPSDRLGPAVDEELVPPYGWVERKEAEDKGGLVEDGVSIQDGKVKNDDNAGEGLTSTGDEQAIVDSFKSEFSSLDWESPSSKDVLLVRLRCKGGMLSLRVTRSASTQSSSTKPTYYVQVLGGGLPRELRDLSECINARLNKDDLQYLMEYLLSYRNWKFDECAICHEQIDRIGSQPLARKELAEPRETGHPESRFVPIHRQCGET